ncbi:virion component [Staphylococcus phage Twort]|uniref:Virion component n=2 Tax=Staphylococcus phage Twort (strain DSM 17442 / HER 48) TaxID=2908167 RepID=A0A6H0X5K5_BPTWO|nr:ORF072 [Staphylococcus phage Twort]AAX92367.1 ORF072 [Staphylococcus phage Twort]QIW89117.1 virion component [Staphylococcus phage Twort]
MRHIIEQPSGLLSYLNSINNDTRHLNFNILDEELMFVSRFYTPRLQLSELALKTLKEIQEDKIPKKERYFNTNTIPEKVKNSSLQLQNPRVYYILQIIILEAYAIVNCFLENPENLVYLTDKDMDIVVRNIAYTIDYLTDFEEYNSLVLDLRQLEMNLNNVKLQLPLLKKEVVTNEV